MKNIKTIKKTKIKKKERKNIMKRSFIFNLISVMIVIFALMFYLFGLFVGALSWFNLFVLFSAILLGCGLVLAIRSAFVPLIVLRGFGFFASGVLLSVGSVLAILDTNVTRLIIIPVVLAILAVSIMLSIIFNRNSFKWDEGDNHKPGYKSYNQREQEKQAQEQQKNEQNQSQNDIVEIVEKDKSNNQ